MQLMIDPASETDLPANSTIDAAKTRLLSKTEINALPIRAYEGEIVLVRDQEQLRRALDQLWREKVLGFDTETRPTFSKGPQSPPALIQLAGTECVYIFQLCHVPFNQELAALLAAPQTIKAGVAVRDDFRALNTLHPVEVAGAVDLAQLARERGVKAQGLRSLAATLLHFRISKSMQCSNWANPKLNAKQIKYAATDAWVGREIYKALCG